MVRFAWADGWVLTLLDLLWFGPLVVFFFFVRHWCLSRARESDLGRVGAR